ncbi:hypothetical protein Tco_1578638 [Tanacetum coccineum]
MRRLSAGGSPRRHRIRIRWLLLQSVAPHQQTYYQASRSTDTTSTQAEDEVILSALPPVDSPTVGHQGGDDGDDDDGHSSGDDADDEDEDEEEHLAPADYTVVVPTVELVSPPKGTKPVYTTTSTEFLHGLGFYCSGFKGSNIPSTRGRGEALLGADPIDTFTTTPVPSHYTIITIWVSYLNPDTRIASIRALVDAVMRITFHSLPPLPPSLYIPPPFDRRDDILESERPPRKRCALYAYSSKYEVGESSTARPTGGRGVDYGFVSTLDAKERRRGSREVGYGLGYFSGFRQRKFDLYALLEDAQDSRTRISQRVTIDSQRVDLLMGDRMTLQETVWIVCEEAYASREVRIIERIESDSFIMM